VIVEIDPDGGEFRKRAEDSAEVARLGREAGVLAVACHPGVVQLLGWQGNVLRLRLVDGVSLTDSNTTADIALAVATTLADLHEIGVVHGAITADHVLVDRSGDPVLCGFGQARTGALLDGPEAAADVAALAAVLGAFAGEKAQKAILARVATPRRRRPMSARHLAHLLASQPLSGGPVTEPTPATPLWPPPRRAAPQPTDPRRRRHPMARRGAIAAVIALSALAAGAGAMALAVHPHHLGVPCPAADRGCRPLPHPGGALTFGVDGRRYRIGEPDDVVVLGRWTCSAARAALLQPTSGKVWVFDQWAPGAARLVTQVPGGTSLQVDPGARGCDTLQVVRPSASAVAVHPDPGS
jgi:hypothetical protein